MNPLLPDEIISDGIDRSRRVKNIPIETILTLRDKGLIRNKFDNMVDRRKKNIKLGDILRLSKRDLSYREIGLILGCTKQSIGKRIRDWKRSKLK